MQLIKVVLDPGAKKPVRAHTTDAGWDLFSREDGVIPARGSLIFDTGVHVGIEPGYVGLLKSKSGLNINFDLTSDGVIDAGYTGSIVVKVYNHSNDDYLVRAGDKITQLVILPICVAEIELTNTLEETERGTSGFGSSGR